MNEELRMREDWVECTLDDLLVLMTNGSSAKQFKENIGLPISRIETIWNETIDFERVKYIKENDEDFIEKYKLKKNDILLSHINSDNHLGKTAIYKDETRTLIHGINLLKLRPSKQISADLLLHQFRFKKIKGDFIAVAQRAVNQSSINQRKLKVFDFILPPLVEQKAIVKKIEELFSSLDSGIADLKKAQDQLKIYRQAVLKKAFEGDWKKVKLGKLITFGPTNGMYKPKSFYGSGTPILRIDGFYDGKINSWASLKKLELEDSELETYSLQNDDIVVNRVNSMPYVGKSAIVKNLNGNCVFESNIMRLRVDDKIISPNFLVQFLISPNGYSELQKNVKHAVNQSSINQADVKNAIIPIPTIKQQHQIVSDIESRLSVCDTVEKDIANSLEKAQVLRQSILKKAFEGTLLSKEEIAKCKAHPDYEPASVLLEKIKNGE